MEHSRFCALRFVLAQKMQMKFFCGKGVSFRSAIILRFSNLRMRMSMSFGYKTIKLHKNNTNAAKKSAHSKLIMFYSHRSNFCSIIKLRIMLIDKIGFCSCIFSLRRKLKQMKNKKIFIQNGYHPNYFKIDSWWSKLKLA